MSQPDFERFFDLSLDMLCIASPAGAFVRVNSAFARCLGWSVDQLTGQPLLGFIHPDDRAATGAELARLSAGELTEGFENRFRGADGAYRAISWTAIRDAASEQIFAIGRDMTEAAERQAELQAALERESRSLQALRLSEGRLAEAQRMARIGSWELDLATNLLWWSAEIYRIFEVDPERFEPSYEAFLAIVHPEDRAAVDQAYRNSVAWKVPYASDHRLLMPDGRVKHVHEEGRTLYDSAGAPLRSTGTVQDVTEWKVAEVELRRKEAAITASLNAVVITDGEGRLVYANPAFLRMWGYDSEQELLGKLPVEFAEPAAVTQVIEQLGTQGAWQGELLARRKDGTTFDAIVSANVVYDDQGAIVSLVGSILDISEAKRMQAQFAQAQKMESVGRLAGGVAHDFNNLLTVMKGYLELALSQLSVSDPLHRDLAQVNRAIDSAAGLTQQLLAFSRQQIIAPQVMNLNAAIVRVQKMLQRLLGEDIELRTMLADQLANVLFDPGQCEQIIINLAVNARDAMPSGGKLTVETAEVRLDEEYARMHAGVRPGAYVMLAVSDTGLGMSDSVKSHLFEPFFTTKESGKGTGLGLAMVYGAVSQNGGRIEVYSEPGQGTTFKIYLPRVERADEPARPEPGPRLPRGTQTILVVEDDADVRSLAARLLERQGYTVHAFPDGRSALTAVAGMQGPIDLLITDVIMPEMNGRVLAERIRELRPAIRVLFTSGYTANVIVHHGVLKEGVEFLPKPYSSRTLAQRVREVLDKPAAP